MSLARFFQQKVLQTLHGKNLHIEGYCQHARKKPENTQWEWCDICASKYQKVHASMLDCPSFPGEA